MRRILPSIVLLGLAACETAPPQRPNIVLIVADDQGWTDFGFMGHPTIATPNLDALADESMVYSRGYVPTALCRPSLATLATGLYPHQHAITGNDPDGDPVDADNRARMVALFTGSATVAGMLEQQGYRGLQTGKWWEGDCRSGGFTDCMTHGDVARGGRHGDEGLRIGRETMKPIHDFIERADGPFLVWYAPFLPHTPHDPPERLLTKYRAAGRPEAVARYYAMCEWLDETVGELLAKLEESGLESNTIVVFLTDNGWIQYEEERQPWYTGRAKISPYDAGIRTPIMIRWPGHIAPGRDDRTLVSSLDVAPTLASAAGLEALPEWPGVDLRDRELLTERKHAFGALFAHTAVDVTRPVRNLKVRTVVREDGWKLIEPYPPNAGVPLTTVDHLPSWENPKPELYNVLADPHEQRDLAASRPEVVRDLATTLDRWWPLRRRAPGTPQPPQTAPVLD